MNRPGRSATRFKLPVHGSAFATLAIVLLSFAGSYSIFHVTYHGPLISSDSIEYIAAARNFAAGRGLVIPKPSGGYQVLQFFPPLYPLVLGILGMSGVEVLVVARWINILLFGASLALVGYGLYKATSSIWLSIPPIALVLSYPIFSTKVFSEATSEPLFYFFSILQIIFLLSYLDRQKRALLLASTAMAGLAFLTRNVGIAIVMAGVVGILAFQPGPFKKRLLAALFFLVAGCLPHLFWRLSLLVQNVETQGLVLEGGDVWSRFASFRFQVVEKLWDWMPFLNKSIPLSYRTKLVIFMVITALLVLLFAWLIRLVTTQGTRHWKVHKGIRINGMLLLVSFMYVSVLAFSFLFIKPSPVIGGRLLSPILMLALNLPFTLAYSMMEMKPSLRRFQVLLIGLTTAAIAFWTPTTVANANELHRNGRGVTSARWRSSETIERVHQLAADMPLISNEADAILFFTGRSAYRIAELFTQSKLETFTRYGDDLQDPTQRLFRENGAALVLFHSIKGQFTILYADQAEARLTAFVRGLVHYSHHDDGSIYYYPELP